MAVNRRSSAAAAAVAAAFLVLVPATSAVGAGPPVVERHDLECGDTFPCPPEIQRRVDFWVKVFRSWGTDELIFHDRAHPERVYSVITSKHSCHRAKSARAVEAERERVENILRTLAKKLSWAEPGWTQQELAYLKLFPEREPDELSRAANRVRCQTGNRDRFRKALARYGAYRGNIIKVLREHGLSEDILYLPFVESAYNPEAYSRAGAAGLWQIMPATARKLGLQLDATMDQRFYSERATLAAARYLRRSTDVLSEIARGADASVPPMEINPFVITSYNYGVSGMARAIRSVGPDYIKVLNEYRSRSFRTAVRNFYASFLAARYVARKAEKYFGRIAPDGELAVSRVVLKRPTSVDRVVDVFGVEQDMVERLNPALTRYVWKGWRLIPEGYTLKLPHRSDGWSTETAKLESLPPEDPQLSGRQYVVQRGDTACGVAGVFGVPCKDLIQLNGLGRRAMIRIGQKLDIPGRPRPTASQRVASAENGYYKVRRGDTACQVAASFDVDCQGLIRANGLGSRAIIHIGQKLRIPGLRKEARAASAEGGYKVRSGDTVCGVAADFGVDCKALLRVNELGSRALIHPGQELRIPGGGQRVTAGGDAAGSGSTEKPVPIPDLMEEVDTAVRTVRTGGATTYVTTVLPEETLGHYADWLGIGSTRGLREINGIAADDDGLRSGGSVELPLSGDEERLAFEASRFEFHQTLVDQFNQHYRVTGVGEYTVKLGDTLWRIADRHSIPYWFLKRTNRNVGNPSIGQTLRVPVVEARNESEQPLVESPQVEEN